MSQWMRTDVTFDSHVACLVLPKLAAIKTCFGDWDCKRPDQIAEKVTALIVQHRPELVGGELVFMNYCVDKHRWEFLYYHPSLPAHQSWSGERILEMNLIPTDADRLREAPDGPMIVLGGEA